MQADDRKVMLLIGLIFFLIVGALAFTQLYTIIPTGNIGVQTRFGQVQDNYLTEGFHIKNPLNKIHNISIREQKIDENTRTYTKDLQQTSIKLTIAYRVKAENINKLYQTIGGESNIMSILILPVIRKSIKAEIGKWKATELVAHRGEASAVIARKSNQLINSEYIEIIDVSITYLKYNDEFEKAIEDKQIATQEAIKAKNMTVRIKEEANQKVITAKAEAQAMKIKSQALSKNKNLVAYEFVQKWDGKLPQVTGNDIMPLLDLGKSLSSKSK